jgi:hypothetical protein
MEDKMTVLNTDHFKLMSNFCTLSSSHGGSCTFVRKDWRTKEVKNCKRIQSWKGFEMTIVDLLDFKFTLTCTYGSLDGDFYDFLKKLVSVICKVQSKGKQLILCGDWNVNFL